MTNDFQKELEIRMATAKGHDVHTKNGTKQINHERPEAVEEVIQNSKLPNVVKDMFRNRTRMGVVDDPELGKMFLCDCVHYKYKTWTAQEVKKYLYSRLNSNAIISKVTDEALNVAVGFMNHGFVPVPSLYGNANKELCISTSWFKFTGCKYAAGGHCDKSVTVVICYGEAKDGTTNLTTYTSKQGLRKIGIFNDIEDIIDVLALDEFVPSVPIVPDSDDLVTEIEYQPDYSLLREVSMAAEEHVRTLLNSEDEEKSLKALEEMKSRISAYDDEADLKGLLSGVSLEEILS